MGHREGAELGLVAQRRKGRKRICWKCGGSQMVKPPAAHTPTSGRGRLVNVTNESTFS